MATSSASASSLNRYKPIVLTVAGLAAAYGCYLAFTTHQSRHTSPLRRSGAIYQRRRRNARSANTPNTAREEGEDVIDRDGHSWYGSQYILLPSGEREVVELQLSNIPTAAALEGRHGFTPEAASRTHFALVTVYVIRWILGNLRSSLSDLADARLSMEELAALTTMLQTLGLPFNVVTEGIRQFRVLYERHRRQADLVWDHTQSILNDLQRERDTDTVAGTELDDGENGPFAGSGSTRDGQGLKQMLYYIAEQQSRDDSYIHRGVECNSCDTKPIRGVRWRCVNCPDYDLCSDCEAVGLHDKTHIFLKVKIPAPYLGNPRQAQPVIYPGKPMLMSRGLPPDVRQRLNKETNFDMHELDALYDQFTCLANFEWTSDPNKIGAAINRVAFDRAFVPLASVNSPRPNLVYDRMFAFYDTNNDGLIGFEEFAKGLACLQSKEMKSTRLRRVFEGYDLDADGYVTRKDFLRMFRALYSIQKEIVRDLLAVQEADREDHYHSALDIIQSSQPLSASFSEHIYSDPARRRGHEKVANNVGEARIGSPLRENGNDIGSREEILGHARQKQAGHLFDLRTADYIPMTQPQSDGRNGNPTEEMRNGAVQERWRRRQFYTDEEEGFGYSTVTDTTDEPSQAAMADGQPAERISALERQYGQELLYQVTEQGLNELLDPVFKKLEDEARQVEATASERMKWAREISDWREKRTFDEKQQQAESADPLIATAAAAEASSEKQELSENQNGLVILPVDEAVEGVEKRVQEASLTELLEDLGAIVQEENLSVASVGSFTNGAPAEGPLISTFFQRNGATIERNDSNRAGEEVRDPTLPHHRPSSVEEASPPDLRDERSNTVELRAGQDVDILDQVLASLDGVKPGGVYSLNGGSKESALDLRLKNSKLDNHGKPTEEYLEKLASLDDINTEITRKGGPGRITFEEFSKKMRSEEGRPLGFLESWLDLGSF